MAKLKKYQKDGRAYMAVELDEGSVIFRGVYFPETPNSVWAPMRVYPQRFEFEFGG